MSRETRSGDDPPSLFDLPLQRPEEASEEDTTSDEKPDGAPALEQSGLFTESGVIEAPEPIDEEALAEELDDRVLVRHRLLGGVLDLVVHAGILALVLFATWAMGVWAPEAPPQAAQWVAIGLFLLLFSFLYTVIPLAFWGRTPGMSRVHHAARAADGEPLTFSQTVRRWLGALFTLALAGLPLLLALGERPSPADRLSQSETHVE